MKYNVIKKMEKAQSFEFILRGVEFIDAVEKLESLNKKEKCRMFADVSDIMIRIGKPGRLFEVEINGETITYEIEQDQFFTWGEIFRPATFGKRSLETINYN